MLLSLGSEGGVRGRSKRESGRAGERERVRGREGERPVGTLTE